MGDFAGATLRLQCRCNIVDIVAESIFPDILAVCSLIFLAMDDHTNAAGL
jgi:hypothetical protein